MNDDYLMKLMKTEVYQLKEGTKTSYYWVDGDGNLPERLSINEQEFTNVQRKGRNTMHPIAGQIVGKFKKNEQSPYKLHKPYTLRSQIWQYEDYPALMGFGTVGISDCSGKVEDVGDLMIFQRIDTITFKIRIFPAMGDNPDNIKQCLKFVDTLAD